MKTLLEIQEDLRTRAEHHEKRDRECWERADGKGQFVNEKAALKLREAAALVYEVERDRPDNY